MNFLDRFKHSKKHSDLLQNRPKFGHTKPYTNNSDTLEEFSLAKYKSAQDLNLLDFKSDLLYSTQPETEDVQSLKSTIDSLQKKVIESESRTCRNCKVLDHENKKLKTSLKNAENNTERLYKETEILSEQLTLMQKKIEDCPVSETPPNDALKQYLTRIILSFEDELDESLQNLTRNLKITENRLDKIASKQLNLSKKSLFTLEEYSKIEEEKHSIRSTYEKLLDSKTRKLEEYEIEIYKLGRTILSFQEKYEELLQVHKEKISDLKSENLQLKEELSLLCTRSEEKSRSLPKSFIPSQSLNSVGFKSENAKKVIEEYKNQIEYLTEAYTDQMERLNKELETLRFSYSQQETLLIRSQEVTKKHEEIVKSVESPLKSQISELKSLVSAQSVQISALSDENLKLKTELKDSSVLEVNKKYSRLVLEFNTNEEILDKTQKSLQLADKTIKDQELIINSLKQGFYPHNSPKELLNSADKASDTGLKDCLDKKNAIIEEMQSQMLVTTQEHEKLLLDLKKTEELYCSAKDELKVLEKIVENLQFELQSVRSTACSS